MLKIIIALQDDHIYTPDFLDNTIKLMLQNDITLIGCVISRHHFKIKNIIKYIKTFGLKITAQYLKKNIKAIYQKKTIKSVLKKYQLEEIKLQKNINHLESINKIKHMNTDLILSINYLTIFSEEIINNLKHGIINIHTSLLPKYRGRWPLFWALKNKEGITGVSIYQIDAGIDTGSILSQREVRIQPQDSLETLLRRCNQRSISMISETILKIKKSDLKPYHVKHSDRDSYYSFPGRNDVKDFISEGGKFFD